MSSPVPTALEQAAHTLHLHIGRYETLRMDGAEREAFADAVDKVQLHQDPECFEPISRWWHDDAPLTADPKHTGEDTARRAERVIAYQDDVPFMAHWPAHNRIEVMPSLARVRAEVNTSRLASGRFGADINILRFQDCRWVLFAAVVSGTWELPGGLQTPR